MLVPWEQSHRVNKMHKMISGALAALFLCTALSAGNPNIKPDITLKLYPEGQTVDKGIVENGVAITLGPVESNGLEGPEELVGDGNLGNISDPHIDIYLPKKGNGQMLVCCPGGGYKYCSSYNEGTRVAAWCLKHGIACCVVLYRMPNHHSVVPLTDVQNAFRYCRAHQEEWGVKQLGIIGFSAGGHLAASASTLWTDAVTRPDFSVLVYPVITMEADVTHKGTRSNLTDHKPDLVNYYSLENQVNASTPTTLLLLCQDDKVVPPENSIRYYSKMVTCKVPGELHVFTDGGHGWGFTTPEYGQDKLSPGQREDFFRILSRWLEDRRKEIK